MKKKLLCIAVSLFALFALSACGDTSQPTPQDNMEPESEVSETEVVDADTSTLLLDENGLKITYKSVDYEGIFGPDVKLLIENDSEKPLMIQAENCSVNGFMLNPTFSSEVASGKKMNTDLSFDSSDLEENGITEIETIELVFRIYNADDWTDVYKTEIVTFECK